MALLFTQRMLCKYSYNGRGNKKLCFEKLLVNKVIHVRTLNYIELVSVFNQLRVYFYRVCDSCKKVCHD